MKEKLKNAGIFLLIFVPICWLAFVSVENKNLSDKNVRLQKENDSIKEESKKAAQIVNTTIEFNGKKSKKKCKCD